MVLPGREKKYSHKLSEPLPYVYLAPLLVLLMARTASLATRDCDRQNKKAQLMESPQTG